ncbi:ATP-binding cassette domain-containing protein [Pantoea sp. Tr-811]|uniref:ATP-binding cassette domain-containing protein n=1 Tax=Pantoea sp. Tr-811 TaxID=2608361 RepID=UPI00351ABCF5
MTPIIELQSVSRQLIGHPVLQGSSLAVTQGGSCAIVGASGSGKSTLLNIIGLLDQPCQGKLPLDGCDMSNADAGIRAVTRNRLLHTSGNTPRPYES